MSRTMKLSRLGVVLLVGLLALPWLLSPRVARAEAIFEAVDNDADNQLWDCSARKVPFGTRGDDVLRCFSFRYNVPPEGIQRAYLHVTIDAPTGSLQDTDSLMLATATHFPAECDWAKGAMAGCVPLHGGFKGGEVSLNVDLLNLACDSNTTLPFQHTAEMQQAVIAQLNTGVMHFMLQDDTAVMDAQLVLNGIGDLQQCGTTTEAGLPPGTTSGTTTPTSSSTIPSLGTREPLQTSGMALQAGQRQVVAGQLVWIPVWLINAANVANANFEVRYDAAVALPEGEVEGGNIFNNQAFDANTAETGTILAGFAGTSGINGTGTVAWIPFRAVGQPGDRTALTLNVSTIDSPDGSSLTIERIDGQILVVDENGLVPGDCDGDTLLNEVDALCALQMSVRRIPEQLVLDLDENGTVDSRDAVVILQRALRGT